MIRRMIEAAFNTMIKGNKNGGNHNQNVIS